MNEHIDKLVLRIFLSLFLFGMLFVFKYIYSFFFPSTRVLIFKRFYPEKNPAETLHLFSRILGLGAAFSGMNISLVEGLYIALFDFFIHAFIIFALFLLSTYILDSITLYHFEHSAEVTKKKNIAFSLVSFGNSLASANLLYQILSMAKGSIIVIFTLWVLGLSLIGISTKAYNFISLLKFNHGLRLRNMGTAASYCGFLIGASFLSGACLKIDYSLSGDKDQLIGFIFTFFMNICLTLIIFPIVNICLKWVFKVQYMSPVALSNSENLEEGQQRILGLGVYEGVFFLLVATFTALIIGKVNLGTFYL
jgi:hypothetical protein